MALTIHSRNPLDRIAYDHPPVLPVAIPKGAVKCRVRYRIGAITRLFVKYPDRIEEWIACIRNTDGQDMLHPLLLQGRNQTTTATKLPWAIAKEIRITP